MSEVDPNKMKVVELRSELSTRGLDTKGNKAVLVRRLKTAMDKEAGAVAGMLCLKFCYCWLNLLIMCLVIVS